MIIRYVRYILIVCWMLGLTSCVNFLDTTNENTLPAHGRIDFSCALNATTAVCMRRLGIISINNAFFK